MTALLLTIFVLLLVAGAPIAVCLGLSSAIVIVDAGAAGPRCLRSAA